MYSISYLLFIATNLVLVFSTYLTQEPGYNSDCTTDDQCKWLGTNSKCTYNTCKCETGYHWYLGKCQKYVGLGGDCSEDLECYDGYNPLALICSDNKCTCAEGYYLRDGIDCRKLATEENAICALNIDCHAVNGTTCNIGKCKSVSTMFLETELEEEVEEKITLLSADTPKNCDEIENAEPFNSTDCVCKKQYFSNSDRTACIPEIGVNIGCTKDSDCPLRPGQCINGSCFCRDYYFVDETKQNCVKTMSETNWNCLSMEWCYALGPNSYCYSNGTCGCRISADFDAAAETCIPNGQEGCILDQECTAHIGDVCNDQICDCPKNYVVVDNVCTPTKFGEKCNADQKCDLLENSICLDGVCQCKAPYDTVVNNTCYMGTPSLESDCTHDEQCLVLYSKCNDNGKCVCQDGHQAFENKCYQIKEFSSYCDSLFECTFSLGESVQCRNRMCQCPTGYTMKEDKCSSAAATKGSILLIALILRSVLSSFS